MLRKERVWHTLNELCRHQISDAQLANQERVGFTTLEVATLLLLDRANTSRDLNQLVEEGRVIKLIGKPVLYLDRSFLEERLGEPLPLTYHRFNSLTALHTYTASPLYQTASAVATLNHAPTRQRAVRWLDLPEEADLPNLPSTVYNLALVVVAHGDSTASSMTDVACRLVKPNSGNAKALNIEPDDDTNWVLDRAEALVKVQAALHKDGVLLLVDLPRLSMLQAAIGQRTGHKLCVVENVNTGMVIEALRCINTGQYSLEALANHLRHHALQE